MPIRLGTENLTASPYVAEMAPGWLEANYASAQRESSIGATVRMANNPMPEVTASDRVAFPDFLVENYIPEDFKDTYQAQFFAGLQSPSQVKWQADKMREENARDKLVGDGILRTLPGAIAGGLASVSTPLDLLAVGKILKVGGTVLKQALRAGLATGTLIGVDEVILQTESQNRSMAESAAGIVGGAAFGSVIGGALAKQPVKQVVVADRPKFTAYVETQSGDGGAAKVIQDIDRDKLSSIENSNLESWEKKLAILEEQGLRYEVVGKSAINIAGGKWLKWMMPDVYMSLSDSSVMRRLAGKSTNIPLAVKGNLEGYGDIPLFENAARFDDLIDAGTSNLYKKAHAEYEKVHGKTERTQTDLRIQRAVARGGMDTDPAIDAAAKEFIQYSDALGRRAVKVGILEDSGDGTPVRPLGDKKWFQRTWSTSYALRTEQTVYVDELTNLHIEHLRREADAEALVEAAGKTDWEDNVLPGLKAEWKDLKAKGRTEERLNRQTGKTEKFYVVDDLKAKIADIEARILRAESELQGLSGRKLTSKTAARDALESAKARVEKDLADETPTALNIVKWKREYKKNLDAKKVEVRGASKLQKELKEALADPTKVRDFYEGMHAKISSGEGIEQGGASDMTIGMDGMIKFVQGRTVDIPTDALPGKFLEGDGILGATRAMKRLNRQVILLEDERFGNDTLRNWTDELKEEFDAKLSQIKANRDNLTVEQMNKLEAKLEKDLAINRGYINKLMREYYQMQQPVQSAAVRDVMASMKMISVLTKLGSVMFSTLGEVSAGLNTFGVKGYLRHVTSWMADPKGMKTLTQQQRRDYGLGLNASMMSRLGDTGEYHAGMGNKMRMATKFADVTLDKAFGLGIWTRQITMQAGVMAQAKMGRLMLKKTLSKTDKIDLARMGITPDLIRKMKVEVAANHKMIGGSVDMSIAKWNDQALAQKVENAIFADVENTIIKPREGSIPFIGKNPYMSLVLQFKHFTIASTSKYWLSDVQRIAMGDIRGIERQMALMGMGYVMWNLKKNYLYDKMSEEESAYDAVKASIAFGGGAGFAMEAFNVADEILVGGNARFRGSRTMLGSMFGPSVGIGGSGMKALADTTRYFKGEVDGGTLRKSWEKITPFGNHFLYRMARNKAVDEGYLDK